MEAREKALIKPAEIKQQCIDSGEKKISSSISKFGVSSSGSSSSSIVLLALLVVQWDCIVSWAGGV